MFNETKTNTKKKNYYVGFKNDKSSFQKLLEKLGISDRKSSSSKINGAVKDQRYEYIKSEKSCSCKS